jgi:hypothetical protein
MKIRQWSYVHAVVPLTKKQPSSLVRLSLAASLTNFRAAARTSLAVKQTLARPLCLPGNQQLFVAARFCRGLLIPLRPAGMMCKRPPYVPARKHLDRSQGPRGQPPRTVSLLTHCAVRYAASRWVWCEVMERGRKTFGKKVRFKTEYWNRFMFICGYVSSFMVLTLFSTEGIRSRNH